MPTKIEKDAITGRETTGHEWDGVRELNTALPKWWLYTYVATCVWALAWFVLYPSIPLGTTYWKGMLGYSQRATVASDVAELAKRRAVTMDRIAREDFAQIRQDPELMAVAQTAGRIAFAENCQACHGAGGAGRIGYPALAAGAWIWGGTLEGIERTVTYGIRSGHAEARDSQMPRFGADGMLKPAEIQALADYVMTLYGHAAPGRDVSEGARLFAENCVACHGEKGEGNREMGAPRLASQVHLYGDDRAAVVAQVTLPRQGVMPNWNARMDPATIKSLAIYVHSLGGGE
ncbi:MAG TPA: cytochrome-c oxidase, cbb3-type subunit III [Phenylobacterium sp.]